MDNLVFCPRCNGQKRILGDENPCFMCDGRGYLQDTAKNAMLINGSHYPTAPEYTFPNTEKVL